jgi:hypothetical protein
MRCPSPPAHKCNLVFVPPGTRLHTAGPFRTGRPYCVPGMTLMEEVQVLYEPR